MFVYFFVMDSKKKKQKEMFLVKSTDQLNSK